MFERFSDLARQVIVLAQEEARRNNHDVIGTEHVLFAMSLGSGPLADILATQGVVPDVLHARLVALRPSGRRASNVHIPFTPRLKDALQRANPIAVGRGDWPVQTGHLLAGMLDVPGSAATRLLTESGIDPAAVRAAALESVSTQPEPGLPDPRDAVVRSFEPVVRALDAVERRLAALEAEVAALRRDLGDR